MNKITAIATGAVVIAGFCSGLSGCAPGQNTAGSTAVGAALGGVLGAALFPGSGQWLGIVGGALVGGIVGNQSGQSMDRRDAERARAIYLSRSGSGSWTSNRGYYYTITPVKTYQYRGHYCRKYRTRVRIDGRWRSAYGRACRVDGRWHIMR